MKSFLLLTVFSLILIGCSSSAQDTTDGAVCAIDKPCGESGVVGGESNVVKIPISELSDQVKFYEYQAGTVTIKYFAVLGSDGKPRTAFNACDVCGGYKGYTQVGSDIQCNNCGRVFSIDGLGTQNKGYGCWPSFLPHTIEGDNVVINVSDIEEGRFRFA